MVLKSTTSPYAIQELFHLPSLKTSKLYEYLTPEGEASSTANNIESFSFLLLPSNHEVGYKIQTVVVTQSIGQEVSKSCPSIDHLGKVSLLSDFWDWSNFTMKDLANAMAPATNDYSCPSNILLAPIEVRFPSSNTFLAFVREVGISL